MSQGIKYTICYKQERDEALAQVKELKAENKKLLKLLDNAMWYVHNFGSSSS